ncbi:MAG: prepilin-type N-terminal cleavage/methylation domain-containing protein [Planctomycetales bacterium]|nr:prepilin-type N-terminal cleavage/methylation domain-containing protein [Planctomycetales bacterium]
MQTQPAHPTIDRQGFTLIELLIVIAIIGVLVGITIPAVMYGLVAAKKAAIAFEVETLAQSVEKYNSKFGEFPPDGSNAAQMTRHLRKLFPQIASSEFTLLTSVANCSTGAPTGVMDPPEALVFFLGGFSTDPSYPISGVGGPIFLMDSSGNQVNSSQTYASAQYNVDRNAPFFEFGQSQLTLDTSTGLTLSTDEGEFGLGTNDVLPVYHHKSGRAPVVYFNNATYSTTSPVFYNNYAVSDLGIVRPYRSDNVKTTAGTPDTRFSYMNDKSFQLISAGLDDLYGGVPGKTVFFRFPSGQMIDFDAATPAAAGGRYVEVAGAPSVQLDNATNFSEGVLENALSN